MATAHLIHGYLGAGKTEFAKTLERDLPAVRYSIDEWMIALDRSDGPVEALDQRLWSQVYSLLSAHWPQTLRCGVDVVLDFGFWSRGQRDEARRLAASVDGNSRLYCVRCAEPVARERIRSRNEAPGGSYFIAESAFDELRMKFEPLELDEIHEVVDTEGPGDGCG